MALINKLPQIQHIFFKAMLQNATVNKFDQEIATEKVEGRNVLFWVYFHLQNQCSFFSFS